MATATLMPAPRQRFVDNVGLPLANGMVFTFAAGTSDKLAAFQDPAGLIPHENPIRLDIRGEATIYWLGNYKVDVRTSLGTQLPGYPVDNFNAQDVSAVAADSISSAIAQLLLANGSSFIGFVQSGTGAISTTVQTALREKGLTIADFMTSSMITDALKPEPLMDHTNAFRNAVNAAAGRPIFGTQGHTYRIMDTINIPSGSDIDLRGATVLDNTQGYLPTGDGGRAKPMFFIYDAEDVKLRRFKYRAASTRANVGSDSVPTIPIWVGDNRGGIAATSKIEICDIKVSNCVPSTMFIAILGNAFDIDVKRVDIIGDCTYGINIEYGQAPTDSDRYGLHPYNINVENFNGYDNKTSVGFLRTASCYNIKFSNCYGKNVRFFVYAWAGDRGISRVSENVLFENCSSYAADNFLPGIVDYAVQVLAVSLDGSTGSPLPAWTNYDHLFMFKGCNFQTNKTVESAVFRYFGSGGKTVFESSVLQGSFYGVRAEPGGTVTYPIENSLTFRDCVFKRNSRDVLLYGVRGILFDHCTFKNQDGNNIPIKVQAGSYYNRFINCNFTGLPTDIAWVVVDSSADYNEFRGNVFADSANPGLTPPLDLSSPTLGSGNQCSAQGLTRMGAGYYGVLGEEASLAFSIADLPDESVDSKKRTHYFALTSAVTKTIRFIKNGNVGDVVTFHLVSPGATVTFFDNDATQGASNRILTKASANLVATGTRGTYRAYCTETGWLLDA